MDIKKTNQANLENKRSVFMQVGLVVALALVLFAFEQSSQAIQVEEFEPMNTVEVEEEIIPITISEMPKPAPPPIKVIDVLVIIENTDEPIEEPIIESIDDFSDISTLLARVGSGNEEAVDNTPFVVVDQMPEFPGGDRAMLAFLGKTVKYPTIDLERGVSGTVYISFVVEKDGSIGNVTVLRGINESLDREAMRVVQSMPRWKPGKQGSQTVRVSYQVPITFKIQH